MPEQVSTASDAETLLSKLSALCQTHLFDIAVIIHDIDLAIFQEIQFDRDFYKGHEKKGDRPRARSLFYTNPGSSTDRYPNLESFEQTIYMREITGQTIQDLKITALIETRFNDVWRLAATSLLKF
jgi:hypothetical protein